MNSKSNSFDRNSAFSINLGNPQSDERDAIHSMVKLNGSNICFLEKSISIILSAECIDPGNKEPNTRHSSQHLHSVGSRNPYIARTILQSKKILDSVALSENLDNQAILDHVWNCTEHLINCERSHYEIYADTMKLLPLCNQIIDKGKTSSHIDALPQVENLEERVAIFLGNGKRFLEKAHELLSIFYGAPNNNANFTAYREWMEQHASDRNEVIELLNGDQEWIKKLAWHRNALDINHSKTGFEVIIENFKLQAGNKFTGPSWRYDFSEKGGSTQNDPTDLISNIDTFINNMLTFFEELFLLCIRDNWDTRYKYEIHRHKDENIRAECPMKYFISSKLSQ